MHTEKTQEKGFAGEDMGSSGSRSSVFRGHERHSRCLWQVLGPVLQQSARVGRCLKGARGTLLKSRFRSTSVRKLTQGLDTLLRS